MTPTGAGEPSGVIRGAHQLWHDGSDHARRAVWACLAALVLTGLPGVGLVVAVVAIAMAARARRVDVDDQGDPSRLATLALLGGILAAALATLFTAALVLVWVVAER